MFARVFRRSAAPTRHTRQYRALVKRDGAPAAIETFEDVVESPSQPIADSNVTVRVSHSCLNYKDGLVVCGRPGVATFPVVPGINLAGEVAFDVPFGPPRGTRVVCVNDHLGQRCDGGYAEFARLPTQWLTALPDSMDNHTAMAMGTAGFTAMQCVLHLERSGALDAPDATVLVTGAAGGVGSLAVAILSDLGHTVVASSSRHEEEADYLRALGAAHVIGRLDAPAKPMERADFDAAVDTAGGDVLAAVLAKLKPRGAVAACGNAGGASFKTTVFPFILRGARLLGVDSVNSPPEERDEVWTRLDRDLDRGKLAATVTTVPLTDVPALAEDILAGKVRGRVVVDVTA